MKTKISQNVLDAKAAVDRAKEAFDAAMAEAKRLELAYFDAGAALAEAQREADAALPQCLMVLVSWVSGKEAPRGPAVILRSTPGGLLLVRDAGIYGGIERKFKWNPHMARFVEAKKTLPYSDTLQLRDVPEAFLPSI